MQRPERRDPSASRPALRLVTEPKKGPPHGDELAASRGILLAMACGVVLWFALAGIVWLAVR